MPARASVVLGALLIACGGGSTGNHPPQIIDTPATEAMVYATYSYTFGCADLDGDIPSFEVGSADTCGGTLTDNGNRTGTYAFVPLPPLSGQTCDLEVVCDDGQERDTQLATITVAPAADIADLQFPELEPWAEPLSDYIEINTAGQGPWFAKGIHDLVVFRDRLYFGYGDATLNLGRVTPIELRYYYAPEPDAWRSDFIVDEEQVDRYRVAGDLLLVPGVDATEDAQMGNAYSLLGDGDWYKSRTLELAWHVHDIVERNGTIYACGSGGTIDDYNNSTVRAFLWRSDDDGITFTIDSDLPHPNPPGDHRLVHLLVVGGALYAFGYNSEAFETTFAEAWREGPTGLEPWAAAPAFFVLDTLSLAPDLGMMVGVNIGATLTSGTLLLRPGEITEPAPALAGFTVLDALPLGDGRTLLMYLDGDAYPVPAGGPWSIHIGITTDGADLTELVSQFVDVLPVSIAFWRRSLYLGLDDGQLWRAAAP